MECFQTTILYKTLPYAHTWAEMYSETPSEKSKKGKVLARPIKIIQFVFAVYLLYINGLNHFTIIGINFTIVYESKK